MDDILAKIETLIQESRTGNSSSTTTDSEKGKEGTSTKGTDTSKETVVSVKDGETPNQPEKEEVKETKEDPSVEERLKGLEASLKQKDEKILELTNKITELNRGLSSGNSKENSPEKKKKSLYKLVFNL